MALSPQQFLKDLRVEIESHPAVNHLFLNRIATTPFSKQDYRVFAENHIPLVCLFTSYLEILLVRAPSSMEKLWLAKVLVDEYGERSDGDDHATCYARYLEAAGGNTQDVWTRPVPRAALRFIEAHHQICRTEPFLVGLGAVGPGHEWAIPKMFEAIIPGLQRAGFTDEEIEYFHMHTEQDQDHGAWLEEALAECAKSTADCDMIRRGALASMDARYEFWTGVQDAVIRYRQPRATRPDAKLPRTTLHEVLLTWWDGRNWARSLESRLAQRKDSSLPTITEVMEATRRYIS